MNQQLFSLYNQSENIYLCQWFNLFASFSFFNKCHIVIPPIPKLFNSIGAIIYVMTSIATIPLDKIYEQKRMLSSETSVTSVLYFKGKV